MTKDEAFVITSQATWTKEEMARPDWAEWRRIKEESHARAMHDLLNDEIRKRGWA